VEPPSRKKSWRNPPPEKKFLGTPLIGGVLQRHVVVKFFVPIGHLINLLLPPLFAKNDRMKNIKIMLFGFE
jgi:hypothetical protein